MITVDPDWDVLAVVATIKGWKSEVYERFVGRPLVVEGKEGELPELARQVEEL